MLIPTRSRSSRLTTLLGWSLAAALLWLPAQAEAQLMGRIKKAAAAATSGKVADKVAERITGDPDAAATATAAGSSGRETAPARAGSPEFSEDVLEITPARLTQLTTGLDAIRQAKPAIEQAHRARLVAYEEAERTYPARLAAHEKAYATWQKAQDRFEACSDSAIARYDTPEERARLEGRSDSLKLAMDEQLDDARMKRIEELGARAEAAQKRNDQVAMRAYSDSLQREIQGITAIAAAGNADAKRQSDRHAAARAEIDKCGKPGAAPQAPPSPMSLLPEDVANEITEAGAKGAGLSYRQFAVLHERVAAYVFLRGQTGRSSFIFSKPELAALEARLNDLRARGDVAPEATWSVEG